MRIYKFTLALITLPLTSTFTYGGTYSIEARGDAMGGVGVVSGSYLTAPFYNPALTALYRRNDDAGLILPSVGVSYEDVDGLSDDIDNLVSLLQAANDPVAIDNAITNIDGKQLRAATGAVVAVGIPNSFLSMTVYGKLYGEAFVTTNVDNNADPIVRAQNSTVDSVTFGLMEAGVSLAKYSYYLGQHLSLGITPKMQRLYTFVNSSTFDNFNIFDVAKNSTQEMAFNIDAGMIWFYGPIRFGLSAMNLVARELESEPINGETYTYELKPQYTVGGGFVFDYATLSADYDLIEEKRFDQFDDNVQMLRVGGEIDILRQLKIRAGYEKNLAYSSSESTLTAGLGISPLNMIQLDVAISYTNPNAKGAYVNFLKTF